MGQGKQGARTSVSSMPTAALLPLPMGLTPTPTPGNITLSAVTPSGHAPHPVSSPALFVTLQCQHFFQTSHTHMGLHTPHVPTCCTELMHRARHFCAHLLFKQGVKAEPSTLCPPLTGAQETAQKLHATLTV